MAFSFTVCYYLKAQRLEQLQHAANKAAAVMPMKADTPSSLVRRFEVSIIPFSASRAVKLREIKSGGNNNYSNAFKSSRLIFLLYNH